LREDIKKERHKLGSLPFGDWLDEKLKPTEVRLIRGASKLELECISRPEDTFYRGMFDMALATWGTNEFPNKWNQSDPLTRFKVIWDVLHGKVGGHALESPSWSFIVRGMPRHGFCVAPGTLIQLASGAVKPIEEVTRGEKVLTVEGFQAVEETLYRDVKEEPMIKISLFGVPQAPIFVTSDHSVLAFRPKLRTIEELISADQSDFDWIPAKDIRPGDYLAQRLPDFPEEDIQIDFSRYESPTIGRNQYGITHHAVRFDDKDRLGKRTIDEDLCRIIGWYLAEGWVPKTSRKRQRVCFSLGRSDLYAQKLKDSVLKVFPSDARFPVNALTKKLSHGFEIQNNAFAKFLSEQFGRTEIEKRLPSWVYSLKKPLAKVLLEAYLEGDGWKSKHGWKACSISLELILGMKTLAEKLGLSTRFRILRAQASKRYRNPHDQGWLILHDTTEDLNEVPNLYPAQKKVIRVGDFLLRLVRKTEQVLYTGRVFNLEVPRGNSYTTLGATIHNCQDRTSRVGSVFGSSGCRDNARGLDCDFILYPSLYDDPEIRKKLEKHFKEVRKLYHWLITKKLLSYQDARSILPMSYHHPYTVQRNLRAWLAFFSGRACFGEEFAINSMSWRLRQFMIDEGWYMIADVMRPRCDYAKKCLSTNPYYAALFQGCGRWPMPEESKDAASFPFPNTSKRIQEECLGFKIPAPNEYLDITRDEAGFEKISKKEKEVFCS